MAILRSLLGSIIWEFLCQVALNILVTSVTSRTLAKCLKKLQPHLQDLHQFGSMLVITGPCIVNWIQIIHPFMHIVWLSAFFLTWLGLVFPLPIVSIPSYRQGLL